MKTNLLKTFLLLSTVMVMGCKSETSQPDLLTLKPIIAANGKQWGEALKTKNITLIKELYDANAHYLPDNDAALHGNDAISNYWKASLNFLSDLQLSMETLEGTKELLYETGTGIALLNSQNSTDTLRFKYVNVWKLQSDGSYKVVIDMFNSIK